MDRVRVLIIGVGGTIASVVTEAGLAPGMDVAEILKKALGGSLPERYRGKDLRPDEGRQLPNAPRGLG